MMFFEIERVYYARRKIARLDAERRDEGGREVAMRRYLGRGNHGHPGAEGAGNLSGTSV
jgi:hypothetical protein